MPVGRTSELARRCASARNCRVLLCQQSGSRRSLCGLYADVLPYERIQAKRMARHQNRPDVRRTYKLAWGDRPTLGTGTEVLAARLREHGLGDLADDESGSGRFVFDLWRRDVPPNRLTLELLRSAGNALVAIADAGLAVTRAFSGDEGFDFDIPAGKLEVSNEIKNPEEAVLEFERFEAGEATLVQALRGRANLRGWRTSSVWIEMEPTRHRARVMMGDSEIGRADVPAVLWDRMKAAEDERLYADGHLAVRRAHGGSVETGTLSCYFLPESPIKYG